MLQKDIYLNGGGGMQKKTTHIVRVEYFYLDDLSYYGFLSGFGNIKPSTLREDKTVTINGLYSYPPTEGSSGTLLELSISEANPIIILILMQATSYVR